jgi:hypothetical protein
VQAEAEQSQNSVVNLLRVEFHALLPSQPLDRDLTARTHLHLQFANPQQSHADERVVGMPDLFEAS